MVIATPVKIPPFCEELEDGALRYNFTPPQMRVMESKADIIGLLCGAQFGKALDVETLVPTINGFIKMGDITIGDVLFDDKGNPCLVTAVTPVMRGHKCYKVVFDDGAFLVADAEHLWRTQSYKQRKNQARWRDKPQRIYKRGESHGVLTTEQIKDTLYCHKGANHSIRYPEAPKYPERTLLIPPYTLGVWLGDGTSGTSDITSADTEILSYIEREGVRVSEGREGNSGKALRYSLDSNRRGCVAVVDTPFRVKLKELNLLCNKHIPHVYLISSPAQRLTLLQGLMDTDGSVNRTNGSCEITLKDNQLASDVILLLRSLGIKTRLYSKKVPGYGEFVRISFTTNLDVFKLSRKQELQQGKTRRADIANRYIDDVIPVESVPVRCIQVDSPSHLYLAGEGYIPTHNTIMGPVWMNDQITRFGPGEYLAVTTNFPLLDKKMLPEYERLFHSQLGVAKYKDKGNKMVWNDGSTTIFFGTAEKPSSLESATAICLHGDEVGQPEWKEESWNASQSRVVIASRSIEDGGLGAGRILLTTTLYNFDWLKYRVYDVWDRETEGGQHPERSRIEIIHADSIENPTFPLEKWEYFKATMQEWEFDLRYRGRYTRPKGMVYSLFDSKMDVMLRASMPIPDTWPRYCGMDFGTDTAAVFYAKEPETGIYYCFATYKARDRRTDEHVAAMKQICPREKIVMCKGGKGDPGDDGWRNDFTKSGWPVEMPDVRAVDVGIQRVQAFHGLHKVKYFADLTDILSEKASYSYKLNEMKEPTADIVNKQDYHLLDAERSVLSNFNLSMATSTGKRKVWHY